jgi:hypothetical protein
LALRTGRWVVNGYSHNLAVEARGHCMYLLVVQPACSDATRRMLRR